MIVVSNEFGELPKRTNNDDNQNATPTMATVRHTASVTRDGGRFPKSIIDGHGFGAAVPNSVRKGGIRKQNHETKCFFVQKFQKTFYSLPILDCLLDPATSTLCIV